MARVLVVSHTPTHPINSGNRARVNSLLHALQGAGHEICFFFLDFGNGDNEKMMEEWDTFWTLPYIFPRLSTINRRMRVYISEKLKIDLYKPYKLDDWYRNRLDKEIRRLTEKYSFDVVLVEYVFFSKAFLSFSKAVKILDTHDIFGDRHKLFLKHGQQPTWFYTTPEEEAIGLQRADVVLAIQERENKYFSSLAPRTNVMTVGHITRIAPPSSAKEFANRLLFIGSGNNVNIDALNFFLDDIWPEIQKRVPNTQLAVVGNICKQFPALPEGCYAAGEVADLGESYSAADIVINPVRFGTGLKIKNIEALGYGLPLVTTQAGVEGLESGAGKAFLVANNSEEFVEHVCNLLSKETARSTLSRRALEYAQSYNDQATRPLLDYIDQALEMKLDANHEGEVQSR